MVVTSGTPAIRKLWKVRSGGNFRMTGVAAAGVTAEVTDEVNTSFS